MPGNFGRPPKSKESESESRDMETKAKSSSSRSSQMKDHSYYHENDEDEDDVSLEYHYDHLLLYALQGSIRHHVTQLSHISHILCFLYINILLYQTYLH